MKSIKEKRIREITSVYYSRKDVCDALFKFSKNRECVPRYFEGFGKRPDSFQYPSDIFEFVKKGATSFHCSEELWQDPLEISTELSQEEFNELRIGWDLLLDIDSPYLEYSKIYAEILIKTLEFHGVKNIGVKFSGSRGFHIIVPWKAFPKEIYGQKTKDKFPEWPRIICEYLTEITQKKLAEALFKDNSLKDLAKKTGKDEEELTITECLSCHRPASKKYLVTWICPNCNQIGEITRIEKNKRVVKCPECRRDMVEKSRKEIYVCDFCNLNSEKNPEMFGKTREKTEEYIEADLVLVSPRHLFRMPYSLHEKTSLASIVIDKNKIKDFQIKDAKPFKAIVKEFYPNAEEGEAKGLLLQALDWKEQQERKEIQIENSKNELDTSKTNNQKSKKSRDFQKITIPNPTEDIYPPCIKNILKGIKQDGRKRALFILLNFFTTLGFDYKKIEEIIETWNKKNYQPLKKGYIQSQINWYIKNNSRMPPNCDKSYYKELNVCKPDELCRIIKNPVSYTIKKYFGKKS